MEARTIRSAPAAHLEDLAYLAAHLKADPQAKEFASDVEPESAMLQTKQLRIERDPDSSPHRGLRSPLGRY